MKKETPSGPSKKVSNLNLLYNTISLWGFLIAIVGLICGTILLIIDLNQHFSSPYLGILTYFLLPGVMGFGFILTVAGAFWKKRRIKRDGKIPALPVFDFNHPKTFVVFIVVWVALFLLMTISGIGAYRTFHFTESVEFCGKTCHTVMEPEFTAFGNSPHANVKCTECHIGPGAEWFVKAKLSGLYQVYSTLFNKFHRPIETPVENLRPASETCTTCHWPRKFFGAVQRTWTYFLPDEENTPWTVKMLINIGGGDPTHGPVEGIHWHMNDFNRVEYIARDKKREEIPWIRTTDLDGNTTIYELEDDPLTEEEIKQSEIRSMDCMDCHNRPTHHFQTPNKSLDLALLQNQIDKNLPEIKLNAANLLIGEYSNREEGLAAIENGLKETYEDTPGIEKTIDTVKNIYRNNFFPEMKVSWEVYPDHIGHKDTAGCFRCHNGNHVSSDGKRISRDCNACHTIIAQGPGRKTTTLSPAGLEFKHPVDIDESWKEDRCDDCHSGAPQDL